MTPTLFGRIQTRWFLLATVGVGWAWLLAQILTPPNGASSSDQFKTFATALVVVGAVGVIWELIYHGLQQFRWEKDWPTIFGLAVGVVEAASTWLVLDAGLPIDRRPVDSTTFLIMFASTWLLIWAAANGPMKIVFLRWRFKGGRLGPRW